MKNTNFTHPPEEELSAFIDDMLDIQSMLAVTVHIEECGLCRATCTAFRDNRRRMREVPDVSLESAAFWAGAYARLQEEQSIIDGGAPQTVQVFRTKPLIKHLRAAYGTAAAFVIAAILISTQIGHSPKPHQASIPARITVAQTVIDESDALDVSQLVRAHTSAASQQPLADQERQTMIAAENDEGAGNDLSRPELATGAETVL